MNNKPTYAIRIKEIMANMPSSLNTKKEIDLYYNSAIKNIKEEYKKKKKGVSKKQVKKLIKIDIEENTKDQDIPNINNDIIIVKTVTPNPQIDSQFTKNIKAVYDIIINNKQKVIKKIRYININLIKLSFCEEIIYTAFRIRKRWSMNLT